MTRANSIAAAAAAFLIAVAAAPAMAAEAPPSAHQMELARRLFADMRMDQLMRSVMSQTAPAMSEQMRKAHPEISADQAKAISEASSESMAAMMPKMIDRMIPLYAATFSEKELQELVTFYEGPTGRSMLAKMPALTAKVGPMMMEMMPEVTADMQRRLCSKIDCTKRAPQPASN